MRFEYFIAWRYLRSRRTHAFVSIITAIAIFAVSVGIAALIFALALMNGFQAEIRNKLLQGTAHLNLLKADGGEIENYAELARHIAQDPGVVAAAATTYTPALLGIGQRNEQVILKGVDLTAPPAANEVFATTIQGDARQLSSNNDEQNAGIIVGQELARTLGIQVGDMLTANALGTRLTPLGVQQRARASEFRVIGLFASGLYEYDAKWAYVALPALQALTGAGTTAGTIQMKVQNIYKVNEVAARVVQSLKAVSNESFVTNSWQELNRPLFSALQLQQRVGLSFFSLLIIIATLNVIAALTMLVLEKRQDIAILRAQGATPQAIGLIFRLQGLVIGVAGTLLGVPLGLAASWLANAKKLIALPNEIYSISYIHLVPQFLDCVGIVVFTFIVSYLATFYPARAAARLKPIAILRRS
jgi:lipoprotein-releasing system permease protein